MLRLRVVLPVLVVVLAGGWLMGEDKKDPPAPRSGSLPSNFKKLGLTDDQARQIRKIRGTYQAKIDALQQQINDLKAEREVETEKVLTAAQKARLKEIRSGETPKKETSSPKDAKVPPPKSGATDKK
jgi:Spy/CpxP family protein refolding chaperone